MDTALFCDLSAMTADQRARHHALAIELRQASAEFIELPEGYAARFAPEPQTVLQLAEFISLERLCCPFFTLAVRIDREGGPLWLEVTGRDGVKPFIRAEFGIKAA
jgi:hypothetical protein